MDKIKVIIVDDHRVVRDGIIALLETEQNVEIIYDFSDGETLFTSLKNVKPDVILLDITLPGLSGIEIAKIIKKDHPVIKLVMLSMHEDEKNMYDAIDAGASGYLSKDATKEEVLNAIYTVHRGGTFFSKSVSEKMAGIYYRNIRKQHRDGDKKEVALTARECEVLKLIAESYGNKEIGEQLFISPRTVESHKVNIMKKLEVKNMVDLIKYAIKNGIVEL